MKLRSARRRGDKLREMPRVAVKRRCSTACGDSHPVDWAIYRIFTLP